MSGPRKATDKRATDIIATVEAEAMPAAVMRALLCNHLESMLPEDALGVANAAEKSEQAYFRDLARALADREAGQ